MWTTKEKRQFATALAAMGELYNEPVSEVRTELFLRMVETLPFVSVAAALTWHGQTSKFFPRPAELLDRVVSEREKALQKTLPGQRVWHAECPHCDDTGWDEAKCDGVRQMCGRPREHYPHSYAVVCACRATNRTYQRRREELQKRALKRAERAEKRKEPS